MPDRLLSIIFLLFRSLFGNITCHRNYEHVRKLLRFKNEKSLKFNNEKSLRFKNEKSLEFKNDMFLDFTTMDNVDNWYEQSDTVRVPGKSKVFRARSDINWPLSSIFLCLNRNP